MVNEALDTTVEALRLALQFVDAPGGVEDEQLTLSDGQVLSVKDFARLA